MAQRSLTSRTTSPGSLFSFSTVNETSLPTIMAASSLSLVTFTSTVSIYFPCLIIVQESAQAFISFNLCVIRITDLPSFVRLFIISISSTISCGVSEAVGSSSIKVFAPLYKTFIISTLCCIPTEISSILASGSTDNPYFFDSSTIFSLDFFKSKTTPFVSSIPSAIFSVTVKGGINMKCWCTIPIPKSIAFCGVPITVSFPSMNIFPDVGWYKPYKIFISVDFPAPFSPKMA